MESPSIRIDFSATLDAVTAAICILDREGHIVGLNRAGSALLGYDTHSALGNDLHAMHLYADAEGNAVDRADCPAVRHARDGDSERDVEATLWCRRGTPRPVRYTVSPLLVDGLLGGAVLTIEDQLNAIRSARRQVETTAELREVVDVTTRERDSLRARMTVAWRHVAGLGPSAVVAQLHERIGAMALSSAPALFIGEPGTGRRAFAATLHARSYRQDRPCLFASTDADGTLDTGALHAGSTRGRLDDTLCDVLEILDGGTLVLGNLENAGPELCANLEAHLRASSGPDEVPDVRLICLATNRLVRAVEAGRWPHSLFYRLGVLTTNIPPLRDRLDDIPELCDALLAELARELGVPRVHLSDLQIARLRGRGWPGNLIELNAALTALILPGPNVPSRRADNAAAMPGAAAAGGQGASSSDRPILSDDEIRLVERRNTVRALEKTKGRVSGSDGAAQLLGIKPNTLSYRIKTFGIVPAEYR
jgi:PAS domain S-box-containing protein